MIISSKCKFCQCNVSLDIDDTYVNSGDPYKIMRLAACDRCADLRERRRGLHQAFVQACSSVMAGADATGAKPVFERLTKAYLKLICDWTHQSIAWEEDMTGPFIYAPKHLSAHLKRLWGLSKQGVLGV